MEQKENEIQVNKYVYFHTEYGKFFLTSEALEMVYRQKGLICSYSGADEWINHFVCEMIDFYSGASIYNYALGTVKHETDIPKAFVTNKEAVINFVQETTKKAQFQKMYKTIELIIDES